MPSLLGFLRPPAKGQGPISIHRGTETDLPAIEAIARHSFHAYSGFGGAMRESLHSDIFVVAVQEGTPTGFAIAHQQGPAAAWVYAFGVADGFSLSSTGQRLLQTLEEQAVQAGVTQIGYMDEYGLSWLRRLLEGAGFHLHTRVIGYEAPAHTAPDLGNQAVGVRRVDPEDIPAIAQLDQIVFDPLWAYTERVFQSVFDRAACFQAAEHEGQLIGYVLGTLHEGERGHIVRLAVHPHWEGQGIGTRLLAEIFAFFRSQHVRWVSLNTQQENRRSQQLYHAFGFRRTGDKVDVWVKALERGGDRGLTHST